MQQIQRVMTYSRHAPLVAQVPLYTKAGAIMDTFPQPPPGFWAALSAFAFAAVGRFADYGSRPASKRPRLLSKDLLWEVPVVVACAVCAEGVIEWVQIDAASGMANSVRVLAGYMGPRVARAVVWRLMDKWIPSSKD